MIIVSGHIHVYHSDKSYTHNKYFTIIPQGFPNLKTNMDIYFSYHVQAPMTLPLCCDFAKGP